jgi:RNA-splicing ligase RtcB
MIQVTGTHNTAICYTGELESAAFGQIKAVCDRAEFADCKIRIMPDVHAGKGCTIGTTMTVTDKIVPGMVGVDIGCGMETVKLAEREIDFEALDDLIRREIPSGREVRDTPHPLNGEINLNELRCIREVNSNRAMRSIGTLGGGNHFIEVDRSDGGELYLVVHSGSRHIGTEVANHYQDEAYRALCGNSKAQIADTIAALKAEGRDREIADTIKRLKNEVRRETGSIPKDLAYVSGTLFDDYVHDMRIIQRFAALNRRAMTEVVLRGMKLTEADRFTTVHNYIDTAAMILRKGSVSAKAGERLLIPINMRDGSLICVGKGNDDWNQSAPHGAGRLMSRSAAFKTLSMDEYAAEMSGIFTTSVNSRTLDESPMAYKSIDEIISHIAPTADMIERVRPVYNFKAGE